MINKWLALRIFRLLPLAASVVLNITAGYAVAQSKQHVIPLSLPQISHDIDIELDNVFQATLSEHGADQHNQDQFVSVAPEPMLLVGVLIMGEKKLAWIKTHDNALFELENGQQVPGSKFRIEHIFANSVALVNVEICAQNTNCEPTLFLDLN